MRVLHCQNCGKAGLAVFQATTPGCPTPMVKFSKKSKIRKMLGQNLQKTKNYEKRTDKFIKKCKILENVLTNFLYI